MLWFRRHFFSLTIVILILLTAGASYVRFMVLHDYVVAYEGDCDPYTQSCFVGCEDDECTEEYYYSSIQRYAPTVEAQCGTDITDCEAAYECLPEDGDRCEITYCDPAVDGEDACETLTEEDFVDDSSENIEEEESEDVSMEEGDTEGEVTDESEDALEEVPEEDEGLEVSAEAEAEQI